VIISMTDLNHDHLSYYNELAGGTKGAALFKTERHYYDLFYYDLVEFFNDKCEKKRCWVSFEPNGKEYDPSSGILKRGGYLTKNFIYSEPERADFLVLTHEYRWKDYPFLLRKYKNFEKIQTLEKQGVELLTIFKKKDE